VRTDGSRQVQLLAFEGEFVRWAMPSNAILHVVEERDWRGGQAHDAAQVAGIAVSPLLTPVRVLVLSSGQVEVPVRIRGSLSLVEVASGDLQPLPTEFGRSSLATRVALQGGKPALIVLDVKRLAEAVTHLTSSASAPSGDSR
jgi:hypothetical protein